ncbi:MAG: hypothetical protein J2P32_18455, partial [Actinobacteria bacterium]|nr:hypothetical protein [Actinomycetota bacterium]
TTSWPKCAACWPACCSEPFRTNFGPTNVVVWEVAIGAELGQPEIAEQVEREPIAVELLASTDRHAALHFDLARCNAHADGNRDAQALRHLDSADRLAPSIA